MTEWWPGIIVAGIGLLFGGIYLLLSKHRQEEPEDLENDETFAKLSQRATLALDQLKELMAERHQIEPEVFASEKHRLELEAAAALRRRDDHKSKTKKKKAPAPAAEVSRSPVAAHGFGARHPQLVGAIWGGGVVLFFALIFNFLSKDQTPRGESMTGGPALASPSDPRYEALLMLGAIAISDEQSSQKIQQAWHMYLRQPPPRKRPPMLREPIEWLEKAVSE